MRMKFVSRRTASKRYELIIKPRQRLPCLHSRKQREYSLRIRSGWRGRWNFLPRSMTGRNFYNWRWIIDPTWLFSGRTKNWPVQNFVPIEQKENQTPVSSAVTSVRTLAFLNEPSMQREILPQYAELSTT